MTDDANTLITTQRAAKLLGCNIRHIRVLVNKGKEGPFPNAKRVSDDLTSAGFRWYIPRGEVQRYSRAKQDGGWPRGQSRTDN